MDTYAELCKRLAEEDWEGARDLELVRGSGWNEAKHLVAKAALAMSNLEGGGRIVIGIDGSRKGRDRLAGMDEDASATFDEDVVSELVNEYADPPVQVRVRKMSDGGRHFVVIGVQGFDYQPTLCSRSLDRGGEEYLEAGRLYYRPRGRAESSARLAQDDMRELLDVAVAKRHNYWLRVRMCMGIDMGPGAGMGGAPGRAEPDLGGGRVLAAVKERAHYAITMQPRSPKDFALDELEDMVGDCRVRRRELPYPYAPDGRMQRLENCIGASHMGGLHAGVWRLYRSGQFSECLGLYEARWPPNQPPSRGSRAPPRERFLEPALTLYQISEVFLFASRLARRIPDVWQIKIDLCGMQDRMLDVRVPEWFGLLGEYKCSVPVISLSAELDSGLLQACYADLAVEKTIEVLGRFGWREKRLEMSLREEQDRLYRWGETKSMPVPISG